jgi:hypothetical protein
MDAKPFGWVYERQLPDSARPGCSRMTPQRICARVLTEESAMLNWLLSLWRRISAWMMPGRAIAAHHDPGSDSYQPSNLHARHYR